MEAVWLGLYLFVTIASLLIGYRLGLLKRQQSCQTVPPQAFSKSSQTRPISPVFVHNNDDPHKQVLATVFSMMHHASIPVNAQVVLSQSHAWQNDFSVCDSVYATRTSVRTDHPNRCQAVVRLPEKYRSYNDISHRLGSTTWPQVLKDQYQVSTVIYTLQSHITKIMCLLLYRKIILKKEVTMVNENILPYSSDSVRTSCKPSYN